MKPRRFKTIALLLLAFGLILYGIQSGEVQVVLQKAILICLECVGLG